MAIADSSHPSDPSLPKPATLIHRGEHDHDVLKLQQQLHRLGYPVAEDGMFGPQTEAALRDAQAHAGVTPNGIAGPQSTLALSNLEANGYHADPHAMHAPHAPHLPHAPHAPHADPVAGAEHLPEHHPHESTAHHAPDTDLGTLPFPGDHRDDHGASAQDLDHAHVEEDPYKPDEHHDLHGHEDPYAPEEDRIAPLHDSYGHEDPYASHQEPEPDHGESKDDDGD